MCNCIQAVNNELAERKANTEIHVPFTLSKITRVCIETEKVDGNKRGKPMKVFASFCPFCGQEYAAQQPRALDAALWVCQNCGEASELSSQRCSVCNTPRQ